MKGGDEPPFFIGVARLLSIVPGARVSPVAPAGFHPVIRVKAIRILAGGRGGYGWLQIGSARCFRSPATLRFHHEKRAPKRPSPAFAGRAYSVRPNALRCE
jgi:hypothetical protein